jgi:hypothetical protein
VSIAVLRTKIHNMTGSTGILTYLELQVYPVLLSNEAKELEDAAVKLIADFGEHKPPEPTDPDDADLLRRYRQDMGTAAESVCELFKMLCAKRPSLLQRFFNIYLENGQDPDIKARPHFCLSSASVHESMCNVRSIAYSADV